MNNKWVVVGAGGIGRQHCRDIVTADLGVLHAVVDINPQVRREYNAGEVSDDWAGVSFSIPNETQVCERLDQISPWDTPLLFVVAVPYDQVDQVLSNIYGRFKFPRVFLEKPAITELPYDMVGYPAQFLGVKPQAYIEMSYDVVPQDWRQEHGVLWEQGTHLFNLIGEGRPHFEVFSQTHIAGTLLGVEFCARWNKDVGCDLLIDGKPYFFEQAFIEAKRAFRDLEVPYPCSRQVNQRMIQEIKNAEAHYFA